MSILQNLPTIHYSASAVFPSGSSAVNECVYIPIPGPICGLRLSSSSIAAGSNVFLKVVSGEGW
jgi:hypothetical protein